MYLISKYKEVYLELVKQLISENISFVSLELSPLSPPFRRDTHTHTHAHAHTHIYIKITYQFIVKTKRTENRTLMHQFLFTFDLKIVNVDYVIFLQKNHLDRRQRTLRIDACNESFSSRLTIKEFCHYYVCEQYRSYLLLARHIVSYGLNSLRFILIMLYGHVSNKALR
jgi:hypothetical protein